MAERFKAAVLKTVERKLRGFESLSLRHIIADFTLHSGQVFVTLGAGGTRIAK
jgi:Tfp pilus assembly ATPase PilU